jgi:hypothetical protein
LNRLDPKLGPGRSEMGQCETLGNPNEGPLVTPLQKFGVLLGCAKT